MALYNYIFYDRPDLMRSDTQATVVLNIGAENYRPCGLHEIGRLAADDSDGGQRLYQGDSGHVQAEF